MQSNDHADVPVLDQGLAICRHRAVRDHRGGRARPSEGCRRSTAHVSSTRTKRPECRDTQLGSVSHLRNQEYLLIGGPRERVETMVAQASDVS